MSLSVDVVREDHLCTMYFDGAIREGCGLPNVPFEELKTLVFDLKDVRFINSCGIRDWIAWIKKVPNEVQIVFKNSPSLLVVQMTILIGFVPQTAIVESFDVPYICESCNSTTQVLVEHKKHYIQARKSGEEFKLMLPPPPKCEKCDSTMELDALENKYFKFLDPFRKS